MAFGQTGVLHGVARRSGLRGFTLVELMVVMAIVAMVAAGAVWALPAPAQQQLEREAQALIARLEVARAQARSSGQMVQAHIGPQGLQLHTAGHNAPAAHAWQYAGHSADPVQLVLGPEPIIAAQSVWLRGAEGRSLRIATDGVRPFARMEAP